MDSNNPDKPTGVSETVGVIMVHGIGEQGRFEHLNGHIRGLIQGFLRDGAEVTVEILSGSAAAFQSMQDSWGSAPEPSVRILVEKGGKKIDIKLHEVWWADVNERYSLMRQVRFWCWGLSIWLRRPYQNANTPTSGSMFPPRYPSSKETIFALGVRVRLFAIGCFFLLASLSVGSVTVLLKRLLQFEAPDVVKIFANYLSSVKLYNQDRRDGASQSSGGADFLDNVGVPPRFSVRRRMVRTIADVALKSYDRWYILAHSQGSVVAFNGLMEPAFGWPGYLDEERWNKLKAAKMAGEACGQIPTGTTRSVPPRPLWCKDHDIIFRRTVFEKFRGILTYGCPLEKFATLWPATVPTCREPAFSHNVKWFNVMDPLDPVSGVMKRWPTSFPECCPTVENIGYASSSLLLIGHIKYLNCPAFIRPDPSSAKSSRPADEASTTSANRLSDGVAKWLLTGCPDALNNREGKRFFEVQGLRAWSRSASAWFQWTCAFGAISLTDILIGTWAVEKIGRWIVASSSNRDPSSWLGTIENYTSFRLEDLGRGLIWLGTRSWWFSLLLLVAVAVAITGLVGIIARLYDSWKRSPAVSNSSPPAAFTMIDPPDPDPLRQVPLYS